MQTRRGDDAWARPQRIAGRSPSGLAVQLPKFYKRSYLGYCRVFLEEAVADAFRRYVRHEEDIREQLVELERDRRPLSEFRRSFLLPQGLSATRDSIIDIDYVKARVRQGWFAPAAPQESPREGVQNFEVFSEFLGGLELREDDGHPDRTEFQRHNVAHGVPLSEVYERLLYPLCFSGLSDAQNFLGVLVILRNHLREHPEATCSVYELSGGRARERSLNDKGRVKNLWQGAAPVQPRERRGEVYPGDREVHHPTNVTVQLRRLNIVEAGTHQVRFPNVGSVAVWVPEAIGGDVLIQEQGGADDDEED